MTGRMLLHNGFLSLQETVRWPAHHQLLPRRDVQAQAELVMFWFYSKLSSVLFVFAFGSLL